MSQVVKPGTQMGQSILQENHSNLDGKKKGDSSSDSICGSDNSGSNCWKRGKNEISETGAQAKSNKERTIDPNTADNCDTDAFHSRTLSFGFCLMRPSELSL
ncbi:hypothetical protein TREES_T100006699 [Tupaia chinensis]|uniref:Uncharacterized protein n=1 Tax=Tupaia chinensis TaxID=246437 RepID=L9KS33_TUPCH|nr:hypothetical protein TREES_T100006699 [Tupaia chinensis]